MKSLIFYLFYAKINNMNVKENLAINIAKHRKALGLTQAELAEQLNYSDKAVSKWERGDAVPEITVLKQLADFYGVTVDTLLSQPK
ncbi:MAG: helix-turn-helix transcriptional regulator [Clostridia bacterium]|nr:helix-turn-helix transcriptional regulator [Clostridia bacterium]